MNRKTKVYMLLFIATLLILSKIYVAKANLVEITDVDISSLEKILNIRVDIMNRALFEQCNLTGIENELKDFELEDMRSWDIEMLKEARNSPTDMAYVNSLKILEVQNVTQNNNEYSFNAMIEWDISHSESRDILKGLYKIDLQQNGSRVYLKAFDPIE